MTEPQEKREKSVKVRFTESELALAKSLCPTNQFAVWLRRMAVDPTMDWVSQSRVSPAIDPELIRQLTAIGNNLNQISRNLNADKVSPIESAIALSELANISSLLAAIKREHSHADQDS